MIFRQFLVWLGTMALLPAAPVVKRGVTLELVSASSHAQPGESVWVGLKLTPDAGYHTYWEQPGLVGYPTKVTWTLPAGVTAGPLLFALPEQIKMGPWGAWGYQREVVHVTEVKLPAEATGELKLAAQVLCMACSKECNFTVADLTLTLPIKGEAPTPSAAHAAIAATRDQQPQSDPAWQLALRPSAKPRHIQLHLTAPAGQALPVAPRVFIRERLIDSHEPHQWQIISAAAASFELPVMEEVDPAATTFSGHLVTDDGWPGADGKRLPALAFSLPWTWPLKTP
jgi:DsbC/DsbD-like thiol-disulfide interchange protein